MDNRADAVFEKPPPIKLQSAQVVLHFPPTITEALLFIMFLYPPPIKPDARTIVLQAPPDIVLFPPQVVLCCPPPIVEK